MNTLSWFLRCHYDYMGAAKDWKTPLSSEARAIVDYARKHQYDKPK